MVVTMRDIAIIEAVYRYRVMTSTQIEALLFPATTSAQARLRLRLLFQNGYLYRDEQLQRPSEGKKPLLYFLDSRGVEELAQLFGCDRTDLDWHKDERTVGPLHLSHLLLSHDIRIAVTHSATTHGFFLVEWKDEKTMRREHRQDPITVTLADATTYTTHVIPDGYFCLEALDKRKHRFLEVDRATVTGKATSEQNRAWDKKIAAYLAWYRSGKYHERYQTKAMGVLTITTGEERLANLKRITEEAGGKERFWFTCLSRLEGVDILTEPLWSVATSEERRSIIEMV
jgi:Replication-relaxation